MSSNSDVSILRSLRSSRGYLLPLTPPIFIIFMRRWVGDVNGVDIKLPVARALVFGSFNPLKLYGELSYLILKINNGSIHPHFMGLLKWQASWLRQFSFIGHWWKWSWIEGRLRVQEKVSPSILEGTRAEKGWGMVVLEGARCFGCGLCLGYFGVLLWTKRRILLRNQMLIFESFGLEKKIGRVMGIFEEK